MSRIIVRSETFQTTLVQASNTEFRVLRTLEVVQIFRRLTFQSVSIRSSLVDILEDI